MFDGAELSFEDNIAGTKKVVEAAHPVNVSVEAELGTIGSTNPEDSMMTGELVSSHTSMIPRNME